MNIKIMNIVYYGDSLEAVRYQPTVYLDGPKNTKTNVTSWRKKLIDVFAKQGFKYTIIIPECRDQAMRPPYGTADYYNWEDIAMNMATIIGFWIPRDSAIFKGADINDRFGQYKFKRNIVLGYPERSEQVGYQNWFCQKHNITVVHHLENIVQYVVEFLHQYARTDFHIVDNVLTMPASEEILNNTWLGMMIERMGRGFVEQVSQVRIPIYNANAISVLRSKTCNIYEFDSVEDPNFLMMRRCQNWEAMWSPPQKLFAVKPTTQAIEAPEGSEDAPQLVTVTPEDSQKLEELAALKRLLQLDDNNVAEEFYDRDPTIIDNDNVVQQEDIKAKATGGFAASNTAKSGRRRR